MVSALNAHEAMTSEMDRLRLERDSLKNLVNSDIMDRLMVEKRKNKTLEERLVILTGKLAQAMRGIPSSDFSD